MKKTIVYLLIAMLLFSLTGCISLSKKHGFGELIILGDNLTRDPDPEYEADKEEPQPVDLANVTVTIDGETKKLGEAFTLRTGGTYKAKIIAKEFEGKRTFEYTLENIVISKPKQKVILSPKVKLDIVLTNAWKFTFDPAVLGVTVTDEVHLVGDLPGVFWQPGNTETYRLIKQEDDTWSAIFAVEEGKPFKIIFDDNDWNDTTNVGVGGLAGGDFKVGAFNDTDTGVKVEPVLAWKFVLDPDPTIYEGIENFEITSVHLVGDLPEALIKSRLVCKFLSYQ